MLSHVLNKHKMCSTCRATFDSVEDVQAHQQNHRSTHNLGQLATIAKKAAGKMATKVIKLTKNERTKKDEIVHAAKKCADETIVILNVSSREITGLQKKLEERLKEK